MAGEADTAYRLHSAAIDMFPGLLKRTNWAEEHLGLCKAGDVVDIRVNLVEGLQRRLDDAASSELWSQCKDLLNGQVNELVMLPSVTLNSFPTVVVKKMEQEIFVEAVQKEREERKKLIDETMVKDMSLLQLQEIGGNDGSTPIHNKTVTPRGGAPFKRFIPSLGVGDANDVSKDLDKLGLVSEVSPAPVTPVIKEKPVAKPRILDLFTESVRRIVVPKVKVTEDTPKRFFKNRQGSQDATPSVPTLKQITSVGKVTSSKTKSYKLDNKPAVRTSSRSSAKKPAISSLAISAISVETKQSSASKESLGYDIYEDLGPSPTEKTTAPSRVTASSSRTYTKKSRVESTSTSSARKLPKMANLPEVAPTRASLRRKTALKRL